MKERCAYMQEVNSLCKDVEQATMPGQRKNGTGEEASSTDPDSKEAGGHLLKESQHSAGAKPKLSSSKSSPELSRREGMESPTLLNPKLVDLATEVKDLNVRFAGTCMQAKQHFASLSKMLTASIERHSSLRSVRSSRSLNGHYVRITQITERKDGKGQQELLESGSSQSSNGSAFETTDTGDTANTNDAGNLQNNNNNKRNGEVSSRNAHSVALRSAHSAGSPKNPTAATSSHNTTSAPGEADWRKQGGGPFSMASVSTTAGSPRVLSRLVRSSSVSTSTDIDSEVQKRLKKKYLRSKSSDCDDYSDTQPRSRRRPKSAVIIEPNPDGETALMCEVELRSRSSTSGRAGKQLHRRSSMEIDLSSLSKSGLLLQSNLQQANSPSTPLGLPTLASSQSPAGKTKSFGSSSNLRPGDRSSVVSIESLDPRTMMISGQLHQNSHTFNASIGSDLTNSVSHQPSFASPQQKRTKELHQKTNLNIPENVLQSGKRSVSMDTLAINKNKSKLLCVCM